MKTLQILHIADVHLDGSISTNLSLPLEKQKERLAEIRQVFKKAIQDAIDRCIDVVLIPGDLWEADRVSPDTVAWLGDQFRQLKKANIPVFIAPGNHDFYAPGCGYSEEYWERERLQTWPSNVHIFTSGEFKTENLPGRPEVTVTGRAFRENVLLEERLLAEKIPRPESEISILLFHGSRVEGIHGRGKPITAPFDDGELLAQEFSYAALGHFHTHQDINDSKGRIRGAYPGCPAGRALFETGEKGVLFLEVGPQGVPPEAREFVRLDPRCIHRIEADLSGAKHHDAMKQRIHEKVEETGVQQEDIVMIELKGKHPLGTPPDVADLRDSLADRAWHTMIRNIAEPNYDLEAYRNEDRQTVDARFAREILQRLDEAEDAKEETQLREALYLGLDALTSAKIYVREFDEPPQEEIES